MSENDLLPTITLAQGEFLHHGTRCVGDFAIPDGPAWFAFSEGEAADWAWWRSAPPRGREYGETARVLTCRLTRDLTLLDTRDCWTFRKMCDLLADDPECLISEAVAGVRDAGYAGWFGMGEAMLVAPEGCLEHVRTLDSEPSAPAKPTA